MKGGLDRISPGLSHLARCIVILLYLAGLPYYAAAAWFRRDPPRPGKTTLVDPVAELQAQLIGNYLVVSTTGDRRGPYHFLIDTGASVTLVSPSFAQRFTDTSKSATLGDTSKDVNVRSAEGEVTTLRATSIKRLDLGAARFENVPALLYDCSSLSVHLGVRIDGILGFPLFRETLLTLDYPQQRVRLTRPSSSGSLLPGETVAFTNELRTPFIPLRVGERSFIALIDSGSDTTLNLNPLGLPVSFANPPRSGTLVSTITGDRPQKLARLNESIFLGSCELQRPTVDVTDEFSSIGGGVLRHFCVTFDQEKNQVTFYRARRDPIQFSPRRTCGLSFTKSGAYWRVASIVDGSPASNAKIEVGDLITRINQEPVERWGPGRWEDFVANASDAVFAILVGRREIEIRLPIIDLVP